MLVVAGNYCIGVRDSQSLLTIINVEFRLLAGNWRVLCNVRFLEIQLFNLTVLAAKFTVVPIL